MPGATLPLDSYRFAQQAASIPCYICDEGNTCEVEFCHSCGAPMALAHQANSQKVCPRLIAVLGASAAGKTVYLGMLLDILSRREDRYKFFARGAFSITLQQVTTAALARCEFPPKTPNEPDRWNWIHCQLQAPRDREPLELIVPDMAGEVIFEELDHPQSSLLVRSYLGKSTGIMLLIDAIKLMEGCQSQDYMAMKVISHLAELDRDRKRGWRRPVAIVFTKADQCEPAAVAPDRFAETHAVGLWRQCRDRLSLYKFFAVGIAGACAWRATHHGGRARVPLRIEPHGVLEPFQWLQEQVQAMRLAPS
jgi:hypothetical protein